MIFSSNIHVNPVKSNDSDHKCEHKSRVLREVNTCSSVEFSDQELCPCSRSWESKTERTNSPKAHLTNLVFVKR